MKRMKGEAYLGIGTIKNSPLSSKCHKQRPPRAIGPTCESEKCKKCKTRHCEKFSESRRLYLFEKFWKEMDWGQKHAYVLSLADKTSPKREVKKGGGSRRANTYIFYLKLGRHLLRLINAAAAFIVVQFHVFT